VAGLRARSCARTRKAARRRRSYVLGSRERGGRELDRLGRAFDGAVATSELSIKTAGATRSGLTNCNSAPDHELVLCPVGMGPASMLGMCSRRLSSILLVLLVASACVEDAKDVDDPRCEDPSIGSVLLDVSDTIDIDPAPATTEAVGGFCDGSLEIKLVAVDALGPGSFEDYRYIDRYHGSFFLIDGRCHFYALDNGFPRLTEGDVSAELLAQLTAELGLDTLAELPSSKDTLSPHYSDALLATATHSLRCRDMQCRTSEATATIEQALSWIRKLAAQGRPSTGEMTAFDFLSRCCRPTRWTIVRCMS
jgi:hypothetical protein